MRIKEVVAEFAGSVEFHEFSARTRDNYGRFLVYIGSSNIGDLDVESLEKADILRLRDKMAKTPGSANNLLISLGALYKFAIGRGYASQNPVKGIQKMRVGEWQEWSEVEVNEAISKLPPRIALAIALAFYTAQRQADILNLKWEDINGVIKFKQKKTGVELEIPVHPRLREIVDSVKKDGSTGYIFMSKDGRMTAQTLRKLYKNATRKIGIEKPFHGLRKAACTHLADNGCSVAQIKAFSGHKTDAMVGKYTKAADQKRLAREALRAITVQAGSSAS
jgi:integrase